MKHLFIDGNNLACRVAFANTELRNSKGVPTGVHFGFFQSILGLQQNFQGYEMLIAWDGKSQRRIKEAKEGIEKKLISSGYKANRVKDETPQPLLDFYQQSPYLQRGIGATGIPQIRLPDYETDDVIASYCKKLRHEDHIVVVTSDKDYYQILHENVSLWNGMTMKHITKAEWEKEYGIAPAQHVDSGALSGDTGDNIFGIPGWGEKTALTAIRKFGTWEKVLEDLHERFDGLRKEHPDLTEDDLPKLANMKTKADKLKFPDLTINNPFTGVALALEEKRVKGIKKTEVMALMYEPRIKLAYSLKKMDDDIELPEIVRGKMNEKRVKEYLAYYDITTLQDDLWVLQ